MIKRKNRENAASLLNILDKHLNELQVAIKKQIFYFSFHQNYVPSFNRSDGKKDFCEVRSNKRLTVSVRLDGLITLI